MPMSQRPGFYSKSWEDVKRIETEAIAKLQAAQKGNRIRDPEIERRIHEKQKWIEDHCR